MKIVEFMGPDSSVILPIKGDGGRERVIETLSSSLAKKVGRHNVELIAQIGSYSEDFSIRSVSFTNGLDSDLVLMDSQKALDNKVECDILHIHHPAYLAAREFVSARKVVLTHHGAIDHPWNFDADGVTFVSKFLRDWMGGRGNPKSTVLYNPVGAPLRTIKTPRPKKLGFMGTLHKPIKRVDIALDLADRLNIPIVLAGPCDELFLRNTIKPRLGSRSEYIGEVKAQTRQKFLESIACMVCPNDSPEAFCMVAAEAMSSGTPVLSSYLGGLPEVVEDGIGGFLCSNLQEYVNAFNRLGEIEPERCIESIAKRFSPEQIAEGYLNFFNKLLEE